MGPKAGLHILAKKFFFSECMSVRQAHATCVNKTHNFRYTCFKMSLVPLDVSRSIARGQTSPVPEESLPSAGRIASVVQICF